MLKGSFVSDSPAIWLTSLAALTSISFQPAKARRVARRAMTPRVVVVQTVSRPRHAVAQVSDWWCNACVDQSGVDEQAGVCGPRDGVLHCGEPSSSPASAAFIHAYGLEGVHIAQAGWTHRTPHAITMDKPVRHTLRTRGVVGMCVWVPERAQRTRRKNAFCALRPVQIFEPPLRPMNTFSHLVTKICFEPDL